MIKEIDEISVVERHGVDLVAAQQSVSQQPLARMQLHQFRLDATLHGEFVHRDVPCLSDALHSVYCLVFDCCVPPEVYQHHVVGTHQIESLPHRLVGGQQHLALRILFEPLQPLLALVLVLASVDARVGHPQIVLPETLLQHVQHLGELREYHHFVVIRGQGVYLGEVHRPLP